MKNSLYCPNPDCPHHKNPPEGESWYRNKGFAHTKRSGKAQRYQCKKCHRTFALSYFTINHYVHRRIPVRKLLDHLVSGSGIRDMGRALNCHPSVIQHRIRTLARRIMAVCSQETSLLELKEDVAADGLENFILSQFFPTNLNILVGHESQFIYNFNSYHFKRKGAMTEKQRERKKALYEEALFEKGAASSRFREILDYLERKARESSRKSFVLDTDEHPIYDTQFKRHKTISDKVTHRKTSSLKDRNCQNKLFPCNYIDRQVRKDLAEYVRETVQFGRNMNNSMDRFTCYFTYSPVSPP